MPFTLSPAAYSEKNALASDGVWVILIEIYVPQLNDYIRVCSNNEDMYWNGAEWLAFPFKMDEIGDSSKGEIPQFSIQVSNINGMVQSYVEAANGAVGCPVKIKVINTNIVSTVPEVELEFMTKSTTVDSMWVTFTLGVVSPYSILVGQRMIRTGCRYIGADRTQNGFKGSRCKYNGAATTCDKTYSACRALGNTPNFGGFAGIGIGNTFYV